VRNAPPVDMVRGAGKGYVVRGSRLKHRPVVQARVAMPLWIRTNPLVGPETIFHSVRASARALRERAGLRPGAWAAQSPGARTTPRRLPARGARARSRLAHAVRGIPGSERRMRRCDDASGAPSTGISVLTLVC